MATCMISTPMSKINSGLCERLSSDLVLFGVLIIIGVIAVYMPKAEIGGQGSEVGSQRSEVRGRKSEGRKSEVRS